MRCRLYARYSTDMQSESSIDDQLRVGHACAAARGWEVVSEHSDQGISGAALGNRPGVQAALAALQPGEALIVNDLSRLSRSQDLAPLLARLTHRGVRVIGAQDGFDSTTRHARMQAGLSGIMSEEFRSMIAGRVHSALEQRAIDGKPTGGKAFSQAELVREIFGRFAAGESMRAIACDLNARGIPSPGAAWKARSERPRGRWLVSALHAMLKNEVYVGRKVWNRSQWVKDPDTGKRLRRERPQAEWIVREVDALVDQETWARVQARFRVRQGRGGAPAYLLSGLLTCGECGGRLIVMGGSQRRYVCGTFHAGGPHACGNRLSVPRLVAEERILEPVIGGMLAPEGGAEGERAMRAERAAAERTTDVPDREVAELTRLVREGILSADVAAPAIAEARRKAAERRRLAATAELPWPSRAAWRAVAQGMREILQGEDVAAARALLREILGTIRCLPEGDCLVAELATRRVYLQTGTGPGIWIGSGGVQRIRIPTRKCG